MHLSRVDISVRKSIHHHFRHEDLVAKFPPSSLLVKFEALNRGEIHRRDFAQHQTKFGQSDSGQVMHSRRMLFERVKGLQNAGPIRDYRTLGQYRNYRIAPLCQAFSIAKSDKQTLC